MNRILRSSAAATCGLLAAAAAGGWAAHLAGLPLAWMLGAMWTTLLVSARWQQAQAPRWLGRIALAVIGCYLGANFTPQLAAELPDSAGAVAAVAALTALLAAGGAIAVRRTLRTDRSTAILSCVPGGLSLLLVLAGGYRSDRAIVSAVQVIRIVIIASLIPLGAQLAAGEGQIAVPAAPAAARGTEWLLLAFAGGTAAGLALNSAHIFLLGAIAIAATLSTLELSAGHPPGWILACAQVALGTTVGARMRLHGSAGAWRLGTLAVALGLAYLAAAAAAAGALSALTGERFMVWMLALAPGGIAEITLVAQLLDLQPVFVLSMQIARLALVVLLTPLVLRMLCGPAPHESGSSSARP